MDKKLILTILVLGLFLISSCGANLPETNEQKQEVKEEVKKEEPKVEVKPTTQEPKQETKEEVKVEETGYKKFKDQVFGIVLKHPEKWEIQTQLKKNETNIPGFIVRFKIPFEEKFEEGDERPYQENVVVTREEYIGQLNIEDYSKSRVQILGLKAEVRSDKKIDLGRIPGHEAYYVTTEKINKKDVEFKHKEVWGINNRKLYVVKYSAKKAEYSKYLPEVDKFINSFELTK